MFAIMPVRHLAARVFGRPTPPMPMQELVSELADLLESAIDPEATEECEYAAAVRKARGVLAGLNATPEWTASDCQLAESQGWNLWGSGGTWTINKDDQASQFDFDSEAIAYVRDRADLGCRTAIKALQLVGRPSGE